MLSSPGVWEGRVGPDATLSGWSAYGTGIRGDHVVDGSFARPLQDSGRPRGYAHIEFKKTVGVEKALTLDGKSNSQSCEHRSRVCEMSGLSISKQHSELIVMFELAGVTMMGRYLKVATANDPHQSAAPTRAKPPGKPAGTVRCWRWPHASCSCPMMIKV